MQQVLTLGGVTIKHPSSFKPSFFNLTKDSRNSKGKMKMQFIAKKRKFAFVYDTISSIDRQIILNIINTTTMKMLFTYYDDNVYKTAYVYVGEITGEEYRTGGVWYWKDMTFDLIEF